MQMLTVLSYTFRRMCLQCLSHKDQSCWPEAFFFILLYDCCNKLFTAPTMVRQYLSRCLNVIPRVPWHLTGRCDRATLKAQRKGVAVYSFFYPTTITENSGSFLVLGAQGALNKLSEETGGRAFMNGSIAPLSLLPFFRDTVLALNRQFALTYLSTHMEKGYHKVNVRSTNPEIKVVHPRGYYYR